ncbi:unnamed protein product [Cylindrotheca closterium]|uniref:Thioredoxin domain-containing protein n=1 Tax=Cylindrotheca closterium TaxID=2856 RepID=A0AAD2JPL1_9STRA|nr:unnamed protein product [Cylindrotheca closterium]
MTIIPVKPQSIFHRMIRAGSKVEIPKRKSSLTRREQRRSSASSSLTKSTRSEDSDLFSSSSHSGDLREQPQHEFEIVNQNEFVDNVLIDNCSDMDCVVHFCNEELQLSYDVEEHLVEVLRDAPKNKFVLYHIDSQMAPYFTKKLGISKEESTLLRFKNGQLIGRISFMSFEHCASNLEEWIKETKQKDDFASFQPVTTCKRTVSTNTL